MFTCEDGNFNPQITEMPYDYQNDYWSCLKSVDQLFKF